MEEREMGADYYINCPYCREDVSHFYITRNYNGIFPFWLLHNHIEGCYESDKRKPFIPKEEQAFLLKTIRNTLRYYGVSVIFNHAIWEEKLNKLLEREEGQFTHGWYEINKYTVIMALIRYYWHLKRYPFEEFTWRCIY
jgi:hypothetical protein